LILATATEGKRPICPVLVPSRTGYPGCACNSADVRNQTAVAALHALTWPLSLVHVVMELAMVPALSSPIL